MTYNFKWVWGWCVVVFGLTNLRKYILALEVLASNLVVDRVHSTGLRAISAGTNVAYLLVLSRFVADNTRTQGMISCEPYLF